MWYQCPDPEEGDKHPILLRILQQLQQLPLDATAAVLALLRLQESGSLGLGCKAGCAQQTCKCHSKRLITGIKSQDFQYSVIQRLNICHQCNLTLCQDKFCGLYLFCSLNRLCISCIISFSFCNGAILCMSPQK